MPPVLQIDQLIGYLVILFISVQGFFLPGCLKVMV